MFAAKTFLLFVGTALAEIVGCYLPYLWLRQGAPAWLLVPAAASLAAYGGVYVGVAICWLWAVDGIRPSAWDIVGVLVALAGMAIIMFTPRAA